MIIRLEENLFEHEHIGLRLNHMRFQKRMTLVGRVLFGFCIAASFFFDSMEQAVILFASVLGGGYAFILADQNTDTMLKLAREQQMGEWLCKQAGAVPFETFQKANADLNDYESVYVYFKSAIGEGEVRVAIPRLEDWVHFRLKYL